MLLHAPQLWHWVNAMERNIDMVTLLTQYVWANAFTIYVRRESTRNYHFFFNVNVDVSSGGSIDWVYDKVNVSLTYAYEFRDKGKQYAYLPLRAQLNDEIDWVSGRYGFLLPANQIIPNSLEVLDSLIEMVNKAKSLNYF